MPDRHKSILLTVGLCLGTFLLTTRDVGAEQRRLGYGGRLQDEKGGSISGIFPMTFNLYRTRDSKKKIWSEGLFVAVQDGLYVVELGRKNQVPPKAIEKGFYLGIAVAGTTESIREPLTERNLPEVLGLVPESDRPEDNARPAVRSDYAREAGTVAETEQARNADRLENLTLDQIVEKRGKIQARLGSNKKTVGHLGGHGGGEFQQMCPKGMVIVGIRGSLKRSVQRIEAVCAPLE